MLTQTDSSISNRSIIELSNGLPLVTKVFIEKRFFLFFFLKINYEYANELVKIFIIFFFHCVLKSFSIIYYIMCTINILVHK